MKMLVHIHIYYPEMWNELKHCLGIIKQKIECTAIVTMSTPNDELVADIKSYDCSINIKIVENRGYDVGPFIDILNNVDLDMYDYIVKLHTKRNIDTSPWYINGYDEGDYKWRQNLLSFCSCSENFHKTLQLLNNEKTGMVSYYKLITRNAHPFTNVMSEVLNMTQPSRSLYVSGTMFIVKSHIFKPLQHKFSINDFTQCDRKEQNSLAHKFECIFGNIVYSAGYEIKSFDGKKQSFFHGFLYKIKRFVYYRKSTPEKTTVKILGFPLYSRRKC